MHEQDRVMSAVVFGWSNDVANQKAKKSWLEGERAADGLKYLYLITVTKVLHTWHVRWCTKFEKTSVPTMPNSYLKNTTLYMQVDRAGI